MKVFIPTVGLGSRMGPMGEMLNKALFPVGDKAAISHIIDAFPDDFTFVIAVGFKADQVVAYLELAHPDRKFEYVEVSPYMDGAGPGRTLWEARALLQEPFYFVACDAVGFTYENLQLGDIDPITFEQIDENWIGVNRISEPGRYCMVRIHDNTVVDVKDSDISPEEFRDFYLAFNGIMYIKDHLEYFTNLGDAIRRLGAFDSPQISHGFASLGKLRPNATINWVDIGTEEKYQRYVKSFVDFDFSKTNETIYKINGRVIKLFADAEITKKRTFKALMKPDVFPKLVQRNLPCYSYGGLFAYDYVPGDTLYVKNSPVLFGQFLEWMNKNVWKITTEDISANCIDFYHKKTLARYARYRQKYPKHDLSRVNGVKVESIDILLEKLPWGQLAKGYASFIHGDLQFDNIIHGPGGFVLLDWREDFGGRVDVGDIYYDFAKLLGGLRLNYDYVKKNLFTYEEESGSATIDVARRVLMSDYEVILKKHVVDNGYDWSRVELLTGIIYLNMAPLHTAPFDKFLLALAQKTLTECICTKPS